MMFPILQIGPLAIQVPGLVILAGLWAGLTLAERRAKKHAENPAVLYNIVFIGIISGVIGARLAYAINYSDAFISNPSSLISINLGLFDPFSGALIAVGAMLIYGMRRRLLIWKTLDSLTPLLAVLGIAVGISHLASGSAFGAQTEVPWGIHLWGSNRHPTQVYEIISAILVLIIVMYVDSKDVGQKSGILFLSFLFLSATSRLIIEAFRGDSLLIGNGLRIAQIVSWVILACCLVLIGRKFQATENENRLG
jgi:phosphatidylglycerol:prolipoprotein diacylglycerol transferase